MELTEWFPPTKRMKPVRVGFYKTRPSQIACYAGICPRWYQYWNGKCWGKVQWDYQLPNFLAYERSRYQDVYWCGLTEEYKEE